MIKTTRTFTRPSIDVPWHFEELVENSEFESRLEYYFLNDKILSRESYYSNDSLIITIVIYWDSEASMTEHFNDTMNVDYFSKRNTYNEFSNIVMSDLEIVNIL